MKKKTSIFSIGLCLLLFMQTSTAMAATGKLASVSHARQEAEVIEGWHQTYSAHGRTIQVDADIIVPDVSELPVVELVWNEVFEIGASTLIDGGDVTERGVGLFTAASITGDTFFDYTHDGVAENNPIKPDEVFSIFQGILERYAPSYSKYDLEVKGIQGRTVRYEFLKNKNGERIGKDESKPPLTEVGAYEIRLRQLVHGVPWLISGGFIINIKSEKNRELPRSDFQACIINENDFQLTAFSACESGIFAEDVPILPFSAIKGEFESWIKAGLIREVYDVRLGYKTYYHPTDKDKFLLLPVWVLRGVVEENAKKETPKHEWSYLEEIWGGDSVVIEAQTGRLLDFLNDARPSRNVAADIILWNGVK